MLRANFNGFERFNEVSDDIDRLCIAALDEAAAAAASVADANAFIPLELDVQPAEGTIDGFSSGIRSRKTGKRGIRLAPIYDEGTLSLHHGKLRQQRRKSWTVNRKGSTYTANRHKLGPVSGIEPQRFLPAARAAGKRVLLLTIDRGI